MPPFSNNMQTGDPSVSEGGPADESRSRLPRGEAAHETKSQANPTFDSSNALRVELPARWLTPAQFEDMVRGYRFHDHLLNAGAVVFSFPERSRVPAGLGLWLLSFFNQLAEIGHGHIHLEFETPDGLFGYLDRNRFLQLLSGRITTAPARPAISGADVFEGRTKGLVEIAPLRAGVARDDKQSIVGRVVDSLINFYPSGEEQTRRLRNNVFTVLGELVDNVFSHSQTHLPGYVSLQAYEKLRSPRIQIGVSDSGIGIPASIRETLDVRVVGKSDAQLIIEAFNVGLSRHGSNTGRGCGLPQCAALAARYGSTLFVRTPSAQIAFFPATDGRRVHNAQVHESVGRMLGTHIYLEFRVNQLPAAGIAPF